MKCYQCKIIRIPPELFQNFGIAFSTKIYSAYGCTECWRLSSIYLINFYSSTVVGLIDFKNGIKL